MNASPLSARAASIALGSTLVVVFVLCAIAEIIVPGPRFSHAWISLFTTAPFGSAEAWTEGILANAIIGMVTGYVFAAIYNRVLPGRG